MVWIQHLHVEEPSHSNTDELHWEIADKAQDTLSIGTEEICSRSKEYELFNVILANYDLIAQN